MSWIFRNFVKKN